LSVNYKGSSFQVTLKKFHENYYFSFNDFVRKLSIPYQLENKYILNAEFEKAKIFVTSGQPYIIIKKENFSKTYQLPVSIIFSDDDIYLPLNYSIEAISAAFGKEIYIDSSSILIISEKDFEEKDISEKNSKSHQKTEISKILIYEKSDGLVVKIIVNQRINSYRSYYGNNEFKIILNEAILVSDSLIEVETDLVSDVKYKIVNNNLEVTFKNNFEYNFSDIIEIPGTNDLMVRINVELETSDCFIVESENFKVMYRESHSSLIPHILQSAENSLKVLSNIFDYIPSEKIIINTYDASDYGFGATTTIPQNYIRLEIEPLEPGYENIPYNERLQWLISHELVHIVVNDQAIGIENFMRKIFQKVIPEQVQPITVFYSVLTNYSRYTPRWHQEAIAVFLETWMSGGFGRILGNFDEMYFRTLVLDGKEFPSDVKLDAKTTHSSFLIETLFYLYGARFAAYLAIKYDSKKLLNWFKVSSGGFYISFKNKFEDIFNTNFDDAWDEFIEFEKQFQKSNIEKLNSSKPTFVKRISNESFGFVTQPHFDPVSESVIFGYHRPGNLSSIQKFDLRSKLFTDIHTLPTPSQYQIASTAFDYETGLLFFTTNNNQLYRDVWALDTETDETKILFEDSRIGHLTVSPKTHELWGIKHSGGKAAIIYSPYPYNTLEQVKEFFVGDEIQQLAVSPSGKYLAATFLRTSGEQSVILINCDSLRAGSIFQFSYITSSGSPENPSWSLDGKYLFWNSYANGVSNIFKISIEDALLEKKNVIALSHTLRGLFKPIQIGTDSLFVFEFTSDGLIPVIIEDKPAGGLPAIQYLGQEVIKKNSEVYNWYVSSSTDTSSFKSRNEEVEYNGFVNLKIQTFIPVISGFQKQKMLGIYTHISDPLLNHDITIEMGYSPFNENPLGPKWHFKGRYEYKKQFEIGIDHNAPDFYDLFNERKRGMIGTKYRLGNTYYWIYDNPLKIKQQSEIAYYTDQEFLNDNLVRVSEPDFLIAQTIFNSRDLRRTIGSSDFEYGNEFNITLLLFSTKFQNEVENAGQIFAEWDHFTTFFFDHNVFHFKLASGYHNVNDHLFQGRFFFGGFGNRTLENVDVKQYRKIFRFPGIPIYSLDAEKFVKVMVENNLPPLRFGNASIGQHFLNHIDLAIYSQAMYTKSPLGEKWIDAGAQLNLIFKHWFNLESTLSGGVAKAWFEGGEDWEWFVSFKLLRN